MVVIQLYFSPGQALQGEVQIRKKKANAMIVRALEV